MHLTTFFVVSCNLKLKNLVVKYNNIEGFIEQLSAVGRWSFTWEELLNSFSKSEKALKQSLYRLKTKGKIALIRTGFYVIIPATYSKYKIIPTDLYINDLMSFLGKKYYVGLYTAAGYWGASHQATMEYYVITDYPAIRNIKNKRVGINFFVKKQWSEECIIKRKTDAGYINVSSPELTVLDLLDYSNFSINRIATIIEDLGDEMTVSKLKKLIPLSKTSTIQRLGYIFDKVLITNRFEGVLKDELKNRNIFPVVLAKGASKKGNTDPKWKVIQNTLIETD